MTTEQPAPAPPVPNNPAFDDDLIDYSDHEEDYISPVKSRLPSPIGLKAERVVVATTVSELATVAVDNVTETVDFELYQPTEASEPTADDALHPTATSEAVAQAGIITPAYEAEHNATGDASGDPIDYDEVFKIDYEDDVDGDYSGIVDGDIPKEDGGVLEQPEFVAAGNSGPTNNQPADDWKAESSLVEARDGEVEDSATAQDTVAEAQVDYDFEESATQGHDDGLSAEDTVDAFALEDEITYDDEDQAAETASPEDAQHHTVDAQSEVAQPADDPADPTGGPARDDGQGVEPDLAYGYADTTEYADGQGSADGPVAPETDAGDVGEASGLVSAENEDDGHETVDLGSRSDQREDLDDALDSIMQSARVHPDEDDMEDDEAAWPAVTISYKGDEYPMFSSSDNLGFFSEVSVLGFSMDSLLAAFRTELSGDLNPDDELVLQIDELGLEYSESMDKKHLELVTMRQIIDLQTRLIVNQSADPSRGLYGFLFTKPNPSSRLQLLFDAVEAAKGLETVARYFQPPAIEFARAATGSHDTDSASEEYGGEDVIDAMDDEPDTSHEEDDASAQDGKTQDDEAQDDEVQDNEVLDEEVLDKEVQGEDLQDEEAQDDQIQDDEVQDDEAQGDQTQDDEVQDDEAHGGEGEIHANLSLSHYHDTSAGLENEKEGEGDQQYVAGGDDQSAPSGHDAGFDDNDDYDNEVGITAADHQQPHSEHDEELEVDLGDDDFSPVHGETGNEAITDDASHGEHDGTTADGLGAPSQSYEDTDAAQQDDDGDQNAIDWSEELPNDGNAVDQESIHSSVSSTLDGDVVQTGLENSENLSSFQFDENEIDWREEGDLVDDAPQEIKSRSPSGATKRFRVEDELLDLEDGQDAKRRRP